MDTYLIPLFLCICVSEAILLPALLLYAVPIRFVIGGTSGKDRKETVTGISWGTFTYRITLAGGTRTTRILVAGKGVFCRIDRVDRPEEPEPQVTGPAISSQEVARRIAAAIRPAGKFGIIVLRQVHIDSVRGEVCIGLGDPVATGMLYGGYWASRFAMEAARIHIRMAPEFDRRVADYTLEGRLRLRHPLVILIGAVPLLRDPSMKALMAAFRRPVAAGDPS